MGHAEGQNEGQEQRHRRHDQALQNRQAATGKRAQPLAGVCPVAFQVPQVIDHVGGGSGQGESHEGHGHGDHLAQVEEGECRQQGDEQQQIL